MMNKRFWFVKVLKGIVFIGLFLFVGSFIVMTLWNYVMPDIFHLTALNYWQAMALLVLCKILLRGGGFHKPWQQHNWKAMHQHDWRKRFEEKLSTMSPEEREKIKEKWRKCGFWGYDNMQGQEASTTPEM